MPRKSNKSIGPVGPPPPRAEGKSSIENVASGGYFSLATMMESVLKAMARVYPGKSLEEISKIDHPTLFDAVATASKALDESRSKLLAEIHPESPTEAPDSEDEEDPLVVEHFHKILLRLENKREQDRSPPPYRKDRPTLPAQLGEALRYIRDIPDIFPDGELLRVFRDSLLLHPFRTQSELRALNDLASLCDEATMLNLEHRMAHLVAGDPDRDATKSHCKFCTDVRKAIAVSIRFRENFAPGSKPPPIVAREAVSNFEKYWQSELPVTTADRLAWLALNFGPFWDKHGSVYMLKWSTRAKTKRVGRERMSRGSQARDEDKWPSHTRLFVEFIDGVTTRSFRDQRKLLSTIPRFAEWLKGKKIKGLTHKNSIENVSTFLTQIITISFTDETLEGGALRLKKQLREMERHPVSELRAQRAAARMSEGKKHAKPRSARKVSFRALSETSVMKCIQLVRERRIG